MTANYEYFLSECNILSEELFNEIVDSLPKCDILSIDFSDISYGGFDSMDEVSQCIINHILQDWNWVFSEDVNFDNKTFNLEDCQSLEDLEEIKERFDNTNWNIINYEDIKEEIQESDRKENEEIKKRSLFNSIINDVSLKDLEEFANAIKKRHLI